MSFLITTDDLNNHLPFTFNSFPFEFDFPSPSLSSASSSALSPTPLPELTPQNCLPASDIQLEQRWLFGGNFGQDITMADSYRGRSRQSESPSCSSSSGGSQHGSPGHYRHGSSHSSGRSNLSYAPVNSGQFAYYPTTPSSSQEGPLSSSHAYYAPSHGHQRTSSSGHSALPRHETYSGSAAHPASERAPKRQRAGNADHAAYSQPQWTDPSVRGHSQSTARQSERGHPVSRQQSSGSSGHTSPGSHGEYHDPYGQQLLQPPSTVPGVGPSTMRDAHLYMRQSSRQPLSDDEAEHGPTELPPRTYSGKSPYDQPKKPGKIPGSAMDYLPILEARFDRLENAVDRYVEYRGQRALSNSILPGMEEPEGSSTHQSHSSSSRYSRGSSRR